MRGATISGQTASEIAGQTASEIAGQTASEIAGQTASEIAGGKHLSINQENWGAGGYVAAYSGRALEPVEVGILVRYRDQLRGRTLELGCGAGRFLGYLAWLGGDAHGVDLAADMVTHCRRVYPGVDVRVGDLTDPASWGEPPFDVILLLNNLLDVLPDEVRRRVLGSLRTKLAPGGLLVFSSHNLGRLGMNLSEPRDWRTLISSVLERAGNHPLEKLRRLPARLRNRRRMRALEYRTERYAVLNDEAHDYSLLHYYIRRDDQERQLRELGFELIECLDIDGNVLLAGQPSASTSLHYVARLDPMWLAARDLRAGRLARIEPEPESRF